ncbi:MAG: hypothetical protein E7505_06135 [Ruminococcus sp.]|nr:hypothetical protein [Ruminococcus sp.]
MKRTGGYIGKMIKANFPVLAGFEFVFKASAFLLFIPLIIKLMGVATDNVGIIYLTTKNIASLMKNPLTISMILLALFVFICISYYEICCIWSCCENFSCGRKTTIHGMFLDGFCRMRETSREKRFLIYLQMLFVFPLFNFQMTVVLFKKIDILENCIRFLFGGARDIYIGILCAVLAVFAAAAAVQSFGRTVSGKKTDKKNILKTAAGFAVLNAASGLLLFLVYLVLVLAAAVILRFWCRQDTAFARLITFENSIYYFLSFLAGAVGMVSNTALAYRIASTGESRESLKKAEVPLTGSKKNIFAAVLVCLVMISDITALAGYFMNGSRILEDILISTTVTAHRGGARFAPENTMYGIRYAIDSGADYVEVDVQLSSDGVVFLLHDKNLKRTTGVNKNAYQLTYEELSALDAGSFFGVSFSDAYIPTLEEVLIECKSRIKLNIELKKSGNTGNALPDKVLELIELYDMEEQCVISSSEYSYIKYIKEKKPSVRTGYIANMLYGEAASLEYADFFSVKHTVVNESFVRAAHSAGKEVHVWTVNTKHLINRMKGLDVDSIITDNPVLCRRLLSRKNEHRTFIELLQTLLYK